VGRTLGELRLADPSNNQSVMALEGPRAPYFRDLDGAACMGGFCLVGATDYRAVTHGVTFWYQAAGSGDEDAEEADGTVTTYYDGAFGRPSDGLARLLHGQVTLMTWALNRKIDELMSCATQRTTRSIPDNYRFSNGILNTQRLKQDLRCTFNLPTTSLATNHIAIGAFNNPSDDGGITLGLTWSRPLDTVPGDPGTVRDLSRVCDPEINSFLIGINLNVSLESQELLTLGTGAASIFHELLHNFGFHHFSGGQRSNDASAYTDRSQAILALEDCMCNLVRNRVLEGNLSELSPELPPFILPDVRLPEQNCQTE
jgi:hypothetical protein